MRKTAIRRMMVMSVVAAAFKGRGAIVQFCTRFVLGALLTSWALGAAGQQTTQISAYAGPLVSDKPFSPMSTVEAASSPLLSGQDSKVERGEINGVKYLIYYADGSGLFGVPGKPGGIPVACNKNERWGKRCFLNVNTLYVSVFENGQILASSRYDRFPGGFVLIQIDDGKPITASERGSEFFPERLSARIVQELKSAKTVTVRSRGTPYRSWGDETSELNGFNEALQYITWAVKRIP